MTILISPVALAAHREQLAAWVTANGLDPRDIPLDHPIRVEEGPGATVIHYRAYVRTADGHLERDDTAPTGVRTEQRTAPCTTPLPGLDPPLTPREGTAPRCAFSSDR